MKVVLLHGWPVSERVWVPQVAALRDAGFDAWAPHLYGRGASIDDWAAQLLREVDGPLVAVGHSMGGYTALALARRAPERIVGLLLVAARADADSFERRRYRQDTISDLQAGHAPERADEDADLEHLAVAQEAMRDRLDLSGVAASFGGPLLVCVGDQDELVTVEDGRALADAALDGRLEVFQGAGHFIALDEPQRFTGVLLDFVRAVAGASA
jgi:pimeloyl-ACP methyl ester carboxylesterase